MKLSLLPSAYAGICLLLALFLCVSILCALTLYTFYDFITVQGGKRYANETTGNRKANPC